MGTCLGWGLGSVCVAFALFKFVGGIWCVSILHRKWRSVPELWGLDWLDIVDRVEREFGVELVAADFVSWSVAARTGITAGQLWQLVATKLQVSGRPAATNGWERIVLLLCEALNLKPARVVVQSRLYADLGMFDGID